MHAPPGTEVLSFVSLTFTYSDVTPEAELLPHTYTIQFMTEQITRTGASAQVLNTFKNAIMSDVVYLMMSYDPQANMLDVNSLAISKMQIYSTFSTVRIRTARFAQPGSDFRGPDKVSIIGRHEG